MFGLVQTNLSPSWESDLRHGSPASLLDLGTLNASLSKCPHFVREIVAHEVQLCRRCLGWMYSELGWRQTEDQPSATGIDVVEAEHIGHEGSIGVGVAAEDDDVRTKDHRPRMSVPSVSVQPCCSPHTKCPLVALGATTTGGRKHHASMRRAGVSCVRPGCQGPLGAQCSGPQALVKVERPQRSEDERP